MSIAAGSKKRRNVQGHTLMVDLELLKQFKRIPATTVVNLFRQAREQGSAPVQIEAQWYSLLRHSDHTYTIEPRDDRHYPTL